jgi:hypothetical protein
LIGWVWINTMPDESHVATVTFIAWHVIHPVAMLLYKVFSQQLISAEACALDYVAMVPVR